MISRDPYNKSNVGRDHFCQIRPAEATLLWGDEFFLGISKSSWSSQSELDLAAVEPSISIAHPMSPLIANGLLQDLKHQYMNYE